MSAKHSIVVMGVSGSGKSTVAEALAGRLGLPFVDGDDLHPQENVDKMASGQPLNDDDRKPWLEKIHALLAQHEDDGSQVVVVCSALKKAYRDIIRGQTSAGSCPLSFIHLHGDFELISKRMLKRKGHFMKADMLRSQFDTLEIPDDSEKDVRIVSIDEPIEVVVNSALNAVENM